MSAVAEAEGEHVTELILATGDCAESRVVSERGTEGDPASEGVGGGGTGALSVGLGGEVERSAEISCEALSLGR